GLALKADVSLLIAGNTGSGKTSLLNALFLFIPASERIVAVEETPEINIPHEHLARLTTAPAQGIRMQDLIVDSLRMRPDRVIVGEIRSQAEVKAFMDALMAGQGRGCLATFHAGSAAEAIQRLNSLYPHAQDIGFLDAILIQRRMLRIRPKDGKTVEVRRAMELAEVIHTENGIQPVPIFSYDFERDEWREPRAGNKLESKILRTFGWSPEQLEEELARRANWLSQKKPETLQECFNEIQEWENAHE
ncbi:MAG: Flp pilus assembly complex ATPase component TadA, partial [Candidatus Diapherotrites archaeon]|nr:Flp pilus assembly complex ATPase component TadA [Candidatus Diapherotrites archaeon]